MSKKEHSFLDDVNPERRDFIKTMTKAAFVVPTVVSVMMLNQKLDLSTANAASGNQVMMP